MRLAFSALLSLGMFASAAFAEDQPDARAIVNKAIKASGGAKKLAQFKSESFSEKGKYYGMGDGMPYTGTYSIRWPDHFRMEIEGVFTMIIAGDKGWTKSDQGLAEMSKDQLENEKRNLYGGYVASLIPLSDDAFKLSKVADVAIEGRTALGVRVSKKGMPDVTLYFDKQSGLIAKTEQVVKPGEYEVEKAEVKQETLLSNYKEFSGCKLPTKIVSKRGGKLYVEAEMTEVKPVDKFDDNVFSKP
jgi:outer membrane lipoprotein-sorting protein